MEKDCVFCKIASKEILSYAVYEDKNVLAFLDINPLSEGHALVIPKEHFESIHDIDEKILRDVILAAKKIALKMKEVLNADANILNASGKNAEQDIFHFHIHVVPRKENDGINFNEWWGTKIKKASGEEMKELASRLKI